MGGGGWGGEGGLGGCVLARLKSFFADDVCRRTASESVGKPFSFAVYSFKEKTNKKTTVHILSLLSFLSSPTPPTHVILYIYILNTFYIALFSALEQTHCARM